MLNQIKIWGLGLYARLLLRIGRWIYGSEPEDKIERGFREMGR